MSNEDYSVLLGTHFGMELEATEGTDPGDAAADGILAENDSFAFRTGREIIPYNALHGSLSELAPLLGIFNDIGFDFAVKAKGSGTSSTPPDIADPLKVVFGDQTDSVSGNIKASPTPTPTAFTVEGASVDVSVGDLIYVDYDGSGSYFPTRIITEATANVLTVWPPLPADSITGGADYDVICGSTFKLLSASHPSASAYWYFPGGEKLVMSGCKGGATLTFEVGQPLRIEFNFDALSYAASHASGSFTYNETTTTPPMCLGMTMKTIIEGRVAAGTSATSVVVTGVDYDFEVAVGDTLIVYDDTATQYKTRTVTSVSGAFGADKTCGVATLTNAPSAGENVFCVRTSNDCVRRIQVSIENEIEPAECVQPSSGRSSLQVTKRIVNIETDKYFRSMYELLARDNRVVGTELWMLLGDTAGNIIIGCIPNFVRHTAEISTDNFMMNPLTGQAYYDAASNDEFFLTFL